MAKVVFKKNWFAPGGIQFRKGPQPKDVPDHLLKALPSTAVIVDDTYKAPEGPKQPVDLKDFDLARKAAEQEIAVRKGVADQPKPETDEERKRREFAEALERENKAKEGQGAPEPVEPVEPVEPAEGEQSEEGEVSRDTSPEPEATEQAADEAPKEEPRKRARK